MDEFTYPSRTKPFQNPFYLLYIQGLHRNFMISDASEADDFAKFRSFSAITVKSYFYCGVNPIYIAFEISSKEENRERIGGIF